eukprot:10286016-Alexandrium_andersonii.AAC.1
MGTLKSLAAAAGPEPPQGVRGDVRHELGKPLHVVVDLPVAPDAQAGVGPPTRNALDVASVPRVQHLPMRPGLHGARLVVVEVLLERR